MKKCSVCGRECKQLTKGMCRKHYEQFKKYGKVLDNNPRTYRDPNEIIEYEDHAEVVLYNKQNEEVARTLIDLDDIDKVKQYKWCIVKGYAVRGSDSSGIHRLIMNCPKGMVVDHINHNPLDNRKSNLRICTQRQNVINSSKRSNNTSGVTGVSWNKVKGKWMSVIVVDGKTVFLGYFKDIKYATYARKQAEMEYFGEYRNDDKDVN